MSFVDSLRQNYNPDPHEEKVQWLIGTTVVATCSECTKVSARKRSVSGYLHSGYDGYEIDSEGTPFFYHTDWGKNRDGILRYNGALPNTYGRDDPPRIVNAVRDELARKGFPNPIVAYEDKMASKSYKGYFDRIKHESFPAFVIYVSVSW